VSQFASSRGNVVASFLLLLGLTTVLGLAFAAGIFAGRHWPRFWPALGMSSARVERGVPARRLAERGRAVDRAPVLTFYEELTAPLTAPPPSARSRGERSPRPEPGRGEAVKSEPAWGGPVRGEPGAPPGGAGAAARSEAPRFTVQVGAFTTWEQAEALRARLASDGAEAYLAEGEDAAGARYRVRVGVFATREEARQAAERLARERQLTTFVTTR
jgi:cell division septation protein DedD